MNARIFIRETQITKSALTFLTFALLSLWCSAGRAQSTPGIDCLCLRDLPVLKTNACQATVPDLCALGTNCFSSAVPVGMPGFCNQTPPAGTIVGPGTYMINLVVTDNQGVAWQCSVPFIVSPAPCPPFTLLCATNKTVECGTKWSFDPPSWTNACAPPPGTVSNGVALTLTGLVTNGTCPEVITATWLGVDDCGNQAQCSQTITVVDTIAPQLDCKCLTNNAAGLPPIAMTVVACATNIPDLCLRASGCAYDACGVAGCAQSPPAGTPVGPGVYPITVQVYDCASNSASCTVTFTVVAPSTGCGTGPCAPPPAGMTAWWPLDELCGSPVFADISGSGNAAIVESGGPLCSGGSPTAVAGKVAGAAYFYGASVRGRAPNAPSLNFGTGSFSMDCWINPVLTGSVHWHPIVDKLQLTGPGTGFGYKFAVRNSQLILVVGDGTLTTYTNLTMVNFAAWNFVGVSVDRVSNTVVFHVNGVTEPAQALAPAGSFNSPIDLLIGGQWAANAPYGELAIDELELFNRALGAADFNLIHHADAAGKCRPQPCTNSVVTIYCPPDTNVVTCGTSAIVFFPPPVASTSCGVITNVVTVPPSGSSFPVGTNTVTATAWDSLGNSASCTFLVIVAPDLIPPFCPPASLNVTGCPPVMPNLALLVQDNCSQPGQITVTQSILPGAPLGTTPVTVGVIVCDAAGNCQSCKVDIYPYVGTDCCQTTTVLRLFSGATNAPPGLLPGGALDKQFLTGPPLFPAPNPYVPWTISGWWLPNSTASKWVTPQAAAAGMPGGVYYYTNRFFLCSTNQAILTGRWAADDTGRIFLNGLATTNVLSPGWAFTNWTPMSITSGFVPGWNTLVFAVTNGGPPTLKTVTGLRTEIVGRACCKQCVSIACPPDIVTNTCAKGVVVNFTLPAASSACGNIASMTASPPSGSVFPVGTNVVTVTAVDTHGNAATCSFQVVVQQLGQPIFIKCPKDQVLYTCTSSAVAYYSASASGNVGPIIMSPPSGSAFPLGTNIVTCYATNACGAMTTCSFKIVVKSSLLGPPNLTFQAGLPDNFAAPTEPAATNACHFAVMSGFTLWKPFDSTAINRIFGHRFTGLPNTIVQAQLIIRMRPEGVSTGSDNDGLFIGITNCVPSGWASGVSIKTLPGTGGTWLSPQPAVTFTNNLSPAIIALMNSTLRLDVLVHDDTSVDFMTLRLWTCPPPKHPHGGLPHWAKAAQDSPGSDLTTLAQVDLPAFGPVGNDGGVAVSPPNNDPTQPNAVQIGLGGGQSFEFTTVLDMNAPDGSEVVIGVPDEEGVTAPLFKLVKQTGWDIKPMKKFFDNGGPLARVSAVSPGGDLLNSFMITEPEAMSDSLLTLFPEAGVESFPVSIQLDAVKGAITVTYPGTTARRLCNGLPCPRGWDGTIKGRVDALGRKGWDGTVKCPCWDDNASRVVFSPAEGGPNGAGGLPPVLEISSLGLSQLILTGERLTSMGQPVTPANETPVAFQGVPAGDGIFFTPEEDGGGILLDLGRSSSFELGLHHSENTESTTEETMFRIKGPKFQLGETNRPPPPVIDLRLARSTNGVECLVDFSALGASALKIELWSNGVYYAYADIPGPSITPDDPLPLGTWPRLLSLMGSNGALRLLAGDPFNVLGYPADEIRLIPQMPPDAPPFDFASEIECLSSAGMQNLVFGLQRVAACHPAALEVNAGSAGTTVLSWSGDGYRLLGAETLGGPWIELGVSSPVILEPTAPHRYFRLVCE